MSNGSAPDPAADPENDHGNTHAGEAEAAPGGERNTATTGLDAELRGWLTLAEQALETGNQFYRLAVLELKLAAGDAGRLLAIALAAVPVVILAWVGLSALLGWFAYSASQSVAMGLAGFTLVQVLALGAMVLAAKRYSRSLGLPTTRRQWRAMMETEHGSRSKAADP